MIRRLFTTQNRFNGIDLKSIIDNASSLPKKRALDLIYRDVLLIVKDAEYDILKLSAGVDSLVKQRNQLTEDYIKLNTKFYLVSGKLNLRRLLESFESNYGYLRGKYPKGLSRKELWGEILAFENVLNEFIANGLLSSSDVQDLASKLYRKLSSFVHEDPTEEALVLDENEFANDEKMFIRTLASLLKVNIIFKPLVAQSDSNEFIQKN